MPPTFSDRPRRLDPLQGEPEADRDVRLGDRDPNDRGPRGEEPERPGARPDPPGRERTGSAAQVPDPGPDGDERPRRAPLPVATAVATLWAALVSYLPVAVVLGATRLAEHDTTFVGAARLGLAGWLLGHGVPVQTDAGPVGLAPLALTMLAAWRLMRAGVHVGRTVGVRRDPTLGRALVVAAAVGTGYGILGALAALALGGDGPTAAPLRALLTLAVFGAFASFAGVLRCSGALGSVARRTPPVLRHGVRTGVVAAVLLLAAGAGIAGLAVAVGGGEAGGMIGAYRTGMVGQAGITVISLGYAPNAAVWAASFLLGPGFAVGTDTVVRTTEVSIGALPAVPLLAGLPEGPLGGVGGVVLAGPVLAGMGAGWLLARRMLRTAAGRQAAPPGWATLLWAAVVGGPVAGLLMGVAAFLSGGPLGGGRLAEIGPSYWQVAAAATVVVLVGTLIGAVAGRVVTRR